MRAAVQGLPGGPQGAADLQRRLRPAAQLDPRAQAERPGRSLRRGSPLGGAAAETKTPRGNSYYWKHVLERETDSWVYVGNGTFIAACIEVGIRQERCEGTPNSLVALKSPPYDFEWKIWAGSRIASIEPWHY
jgi:hypothetical protein